MKRVVLRQVEKTAKTCFSEQLLGYVVIELENRVTPQIGLTLSRGQAEALCQSKDTEVVIKK